MSNPASRRWSDNNSNYTYHQLSVHDSSPFCAIAVRRSVEVNLVAIVVLSALDVLHARV